MAEDKRDEEDAKEEYRELKRQWESEPGVRTFEIPKDKEGNPVIGPDIGWVPTPKALQAELLLAHPFDSFQFAVPPYGAMETPLPFPTRVDGMDVVAAYSQTGGTCVGFSGAQATTGRHKRRDGSDKRFSGMALYCECRRRMGDLRCNTNAGATMQVLANALKNWGGVQVISGKEQAPNSENGIASYTFGYNTDAIRTGIANGIYVEIGISIYEAFLSPKWVIDPVTGKGEWWVYWQTGAWGGFLGGHAMTTFYWSDRRNAFWLPNTWGYEWCDGKGAWMSRAAFDKLLQAAMAAEVLLCVDRGTPTPVGKIELAEPFSIYPTPKVGDNVTLHVKIKNTGDSPMLGVGLAVEELKNDVGTNGYDSSPTFDLQPGATAEYNPVKTNIEAGTWRWWPDWKQNGKYYHLGESMTVTVSGTPPPPPPPPPPDDVFTYDEESFRYQGSRYSTLVDHPNGVKYRKVS